LGVARTRPALSEDQTMRSLGQAFPDVPAAQNNLALFYLNSGDPASAIRVSRHVLDLHPTDRELATKARDNLAWALVGTGLEQIQRGSTDSARKTLEEAQRVRPDLVRALADRATFHAAHGDHHRAMLHYQAALLLSPADRALQMALSREISALRSS